MSAPPVRLRPLEREDLESIREWRNAQIEILRQKRPLTPDDQERYWARLQESDDSVLYAIEGDGRLIGYCGFVHISWPDRRAEISFLLDPEEAEPGSPRHDQLFGATLRLLREEGFGRRGFHRLFTETFEFRESHMATLEGAGFKREGRLRQHVRVGDAWADSLIHGILETDRGKGKE